MLSKSDRERHAVWSHLYVDCKNQPTKKLRTKLTGSRPVVTGGRGRSRSGEMGEEGHKVELTVMK